MTSLIGSARQAVMARLFGSALPTQNPSQLLPVSVTPTGRSYSIEAAQAAVDTRTLEHGCESEVERQLALVLAAVQGRDVNDLLVEEVNGDGLLEIDSMTAVFIYSVARDALGSHALPRMGSISAHEDLRSTNSLAKLLCRSRKPRSSK